MASAANIDMETNMAGWVQIDLSIWERAGKDKSAAALFKPTARDVPFNVLNFEYPSDEDNLGFAIVRLRSGLIVALIDDPGNPVAGTVLYRVGDVENQRVIRESAEAFELDHSDLKWVAGQSMEI